MRLKIIIPALALGLVLVLALYLGRKATVPSQAKPETPTSSLVESNASNGIAQRNPASPDTSAALTSGQPPTQTNQLPSTNAQSQEVDVVLLSPEARHKAYVEKRIEELDDLSTENDPASLNTILSELTNRDPQIRKAALSAAIQFGSRDAIPKLQEAATETDDPAEKAELLDAVEFLKLPSLTEYLEKKRAAGITSNSSKPATTKAPVRKTLKRRGPTPAPAPPPAQ